MPPELDGKRQDLLIEAMPRARRKTGRRLGEGRPIVFSQTRRTLKQMNDALCAIAAH